MSFKVAVIGAGSVGFTREIIKDLLSVREFQDIQIAFMDINQHNLNMALELIQRDIDANGLSIQIQGTMDRREAFRDAKYVFNFVRIGMLEAFANDVKIPLKYGIDQCVGDTLCVGGILYGQRGIAAMLEFCKDIREVAKPGCILLNYANPNAMVTWACNKYGNVPTVGLCHGVQNGHKLIAKVLKRDWKEIDIVCVGINHQTWYTKIIDKLTGNDLRPMLLEAMEADEETARTEKIRIDVLKRFGYFSTESNGHLSEYLPWYRKDPEKISSWISMDRWINGESLGYFRHCSERRDWYETDYPNWIKAPAFVYGEQNTGVEHGAHIVEALETGRIYRGHFNVINHGVIKNLPDDAVVEVPGYVDMTGINIPVYGDLPLGCAAICNASISVQRLAVEAAVHGNIEFLKQAVMMDPLTGAVCTPQEIWQMVDEMLVAGEEWLPQYTKEIEKAKERLREHYVEPRKEKAADTFKRWKTVEEIAGDEELKKIYNKSAHQN
ncbi:MAG: alpha-galactosidase [Lachnospiraceae bacterium]